jgi:predicted phosphodiesterase
MRRAIQAVKPNAVVHLGDYYDDGEAMAEEFSYIPFHLVGGNCDRFRSYGIPREMLCYDICGVRLYMVHGHNHNVKSSIYSLLLDARRENALAALYGHTHQADCHQEPDGLWVLNPGACGSSGGSVGLIEVEDRKIVTCRILRQADLEEML